MRGKPIPEARRWWTAAVLLLAALGPINTARGQSDAGTPAMPSADENVKPIPTVPSGDGVVPASCPSCGGGLLGGNWAASDCIGCGGGCGSGQCSPGHPPCDCCCDGSTCVGRFFNGLYQCVCCPDPCYDPHWVALADASFFADAPRPVTQMKLRIDQMWDMNTPDRAEYYWGKQGGGRGPSLGGTGDHPMGRRIDVSEVRLINEAASGRAGISVEVPYRHIEKDFDGSGFSDIVIGTKALLLDCQLIQIAFGFKTYIPSGSAGKGVGTGHTSLEPSLLWALRLTPTTYLQAQTSLWIPLGGDPDFEGNIFHYHLSLNQTLWRPCQDIHLIGTAELNGWVILNGWLTDPDTGNAVEGRGHTGSAGPGIRLVICDKIDFGVGSAFSFNSRHWAEEMIRFEFRWRF